jgi:hypothetical protein
VEPLFFSFSTILSTVPKKISSSTFPLTTAGSALAMRLLRYMSFGLVRSVSCIAYTIISISRKGCHVLKGTDGRDCFINCPSSLLVAAVFVCKKKRATSGLHASPAQSINQTINRLCRLDYQVRMLRVLSKCQVRTVRMWPSSLQYCACYKWLIFRIFTVCFSRKVLDYIPADRSTYLSDLPREKHGQYVLHCFL